MEQTVEQSIIASLNRRVSREQLEDKQWLQLKDEMREGDELWYYITPRETWTTFFPRCGREGYVLVRDDKVVAEVLLSIS
jgi:hypothetical protein